MMSGCAYKSKRERAGTNHKGKDLLTAEKEVEVEVEVEDKDKDEDEDDDGEEDAMFRRRSRRQV